MKRVFFAIKFPLEIRKEIREKFIEPLLRFHQSIKCAEKNNLHITLHFIGRVNEKELKQIMEGFSKMELPRAKNVFLGGNANIGSFNSKIVFVHVQDTNNFLQELHEKCARIFPGKDTKPFHAHLTLARNPKGISLHALMKEMNSFPWEKPFLPTHVSLMESHSKEGKIIYIEIMKKYFPTANTE